jgi:hypothetical protein
VYRRGLTGSPYPRDFPTDATVTPDGGTNSVDDVDLVPRGGQGRRLSQYPRVACERRLRQHEYPHS